MQNAGAQSLGHVFATNLKFKHPQLKPGNDFNYLHHVCVKKCYKMQTYFYFSKKNQHNKGYN